MAKAVECELGVPLDHLCLYLKTVFLRIKPGHRNQRKGTKRVLKTCVPTWIKLCPKSFYPWMFHIHYILPTLLLFPYIKTVFKLAGVSTIK
jgi:hypothetical protein